MRDHILEDASAATLGGSGSAKPTLSDSQKVTMKRKKIISTKPSITRSPPKAKQAVTV
jgi:hypothetical protein